MKTYEEKELETILMIGFAGEQGLIDEEEETFLTKTLHEKIQRRDAAIQEAHCLAIDADQVETRVAFLELVEERLDYIVDATIAIHDEKARQLTRLKNAKR